MKRKMTIGQKLELSREIRQWVGIGIKGAGLVMSAYIFIPGVKNAVDDAINKPNMDKNKGRW